MYVRNGARSADVFKRDWKPIVLVLALAIGTEAVEPYLPETEIFSAVYVGILSAALSIFLGFRFNEAYERWWEARKLWGRLVNLSRDFGRQVLTLLGEADVEPVGRELLRRQAAFAHVLRIRLRGETAPNGARELEDVLRRLVPDEADRLLACENVPLALLRRQGERAAGVLRGSTAGAVLLARLDTTLSGLSDVKGGCERIKNTVFPEAVTLATRFLVWGLVVLLFLATVGPDGRGGILVTLAVGVMAMGYVWIDSMGHDLKNPFENAPNDTPMTAIATTIERDLFELLGETELPEPVRPKDGVLM